MLERLRPQLLRHEQISALLIYYPVIWESLGGDPAIDRPIVLAAVIGHNLKARAATSACRRLCRSRSSVSDGTS
jgi:hypothetical protein